MDVSFLIDSVNQTSFLAHTWDGSTHVQLDYHNQFDSISIQINSGPVYPFNVRVGPEGKINGTRTTHLLESNYPHSYNNILAGDYTLDVHYIDHNNQIDTAYQTILNVYSENQSILVGNDAFLFPSTSFHSYYINMNILLVVQQFPLLLKIFTGRMIVYILKYRYPI